MATADIYVYGIVRAGHPLPARVSGVGATVSTTRVISAGELSIVVGDAPEQLRARRRDLIAHQEILLALADDGPVLPMRFGTVASDEAELGARVRAASAAFVSALELIDGRAEMNLKATPAQDSTAALMALIQADENVRVLRERLRRNPSYDLSIALGQAVAAGLAQRASAAAAVVVERFTAMAERMASGPKVAGCVCNASFLVDRGDCERFLSMAESCRAEQHDRLDLTVTGPLPCYSFVPDESLLDQEPSAMVGG